MLIFLGTMFSRISVYNPEFHFLLREQEFFVACACLTSFRIQFGNNFNFFFQINDWADARYKKSLNIIEKRLLR